ncbi:MAG: acyl carrier protein [Pirellulales bacterium]|nr:acyl carrier protein [Pirellulales bacterium]
MQEQIDQAFRAAFQLDSQFVLDGPMSYNDVPGWDSVGHMNLVTELESQFQISLEMEEIVAMDSVDAVRKIVEQKKSEPHA